jgi:hypothetical protein
VTFVGELGKKNFHPWKVRVAEFMNMFGNMSGDGKLYFVTRECSWKMSWQNSTQIANLLIFREMIAELDYVRKSAVCFRIIGIWRNAGNQESAKFGNIMWSRFGNLNEWWFSWIKASGSRRSKKSGFKVWTSGRLVNVWNQPCKSRDVKDIHVHIHTRNIL